MTEEATYIVVQYKHGAYEWHATHIWEAHKRLVPETTGRAIAQSLPLVDAINFTELLNDQRELENP